MTLAVKVVLNPNTTNQPTNQASQYKIQFLSPLLYNQKKKRQTSTTKNSLIQCHATLYCKCSNIFEYVTGKRVNPFPKKACFLRVCSTSLLKTLWEKEKLLVTSNFSFSHSVFYPFDELFAIFFLPASSFMLERCKNCCLGKCYFNLFPHNDTF